MNVSEAAIFEALRKKYPADAYALLAQVRNSTGFARSPRTADAIAMGLWPSRGLHLEGFEFKASRKDWVAELRAPEKADEIGKFCHRWWLVVTDPKFVQDEELPPLWGLMVAGEKGLKVAKAAPVRDAQKPTHAFLAAILRNVQSVDPTPAALEAARKAGYDQSQKEKTSRVDRAEARAEQAQAAIREFEAASGVRISDYHAGEIGEAVKIVRSGGLGAMVRNLRAVHDQAKGVADRSAKAIEALTAKGIE